MSIATFFAATSGVAVSFWFLYVKSLPSPNNPNGETTIQQIKTNVKQRVEAILNLNEQDSDFSRRWERLEFLTKEFLKTRGLPQEKVEKETRDLKKLTKKQLLDERCAYCGEGTKIE
jgi:hypothetical protein